MLQISVISSFIYINKFFTKEFFYGQKISTQLSIKSKHLKQVNSAKLLIGSVHIPNHRKSYEFDEDRLVEIVSKKE